MARKKAFFIAKRQKGGNNMNDVRLMGRLTADPEVRYSEGNEPMCIARYNIAVDRPKRNGQEAKTDFIRCVAFGRNGEFAEKYLKKGGLVIVYGAIHTDSYTNKEGVKVYTTEVAVTQHEFVPGQKKDNASSNKASAPVEEAPAADQSFMDVPDEEELPFF